MFGFRRDQAESAVAAAGGGGAVMVIMVVVSVDGNIHGGGGGGGGASVVVMVMVVIVLRELEQLGGRLWQLRRRARDHGSGDGLRRCRRTVVARDGRGDHLDDAG